ncbi:hypothetical protein [Microbulbifer sp. SAOS-129_SWC]|uniref:hypothetical protein n=1 Tax=Microbulbifer sp. SAOS-129_SWC TaxID=3145235 RepID=UPI0032179579
MSNDKMREAQNAVIRLVNGAILEGYPRKTAEYLQHAIEAGLQSQQVEQEPFALEVVAKVARELGVDMDSLDGDGTEESLALEAIDRLIAERPQPASQVPEDWRERLIADYRREYIGQSIESWLRRLPDSIVAPSIAAKPEQGDKP